MNNEQKNKISNSAAEFVLIAGFLLLLAIPFSVGLFQIRPEFSDVKTQVSDSLRDGNIFRAYSAYKSYFEKYFGLRRTFVSLHALIKVELLGVSSSRKVVVGKHDWLYYFETIEYRQASPFTPEMLGLWKSTLEGRRDVLAERGSQFIFFIAPDKQSIYPEHLPRSARRNDHQSRFDQLLEYMKSNSDVNFLDLRTALISAKADGLEVYYRTGTHWNERGAYIAYLEIVKELRKLFPDMKPLPQSRFKEVKLMRRGSLLDMLGLPEYFSEDTSKLTFDPPACASSRIKMLKKRRRLTYTRCETGEIPSGVIYHDSFGSFLVPFLAEHFQYAEFIWDETIDSSVIDRVKPDIVIQEMVERKLF